LIAAKTALSVADYVVTEAGFGADLGAEKFFDIFARISGMKPDAVVLVATVRALKMHGGVLKADLGKEDLSAIKKGFANLKAHINNIKKFGYTPVVAINRFTADTAKELNLVKKLCEKEGVTAVISEGWGKGGKGCINLAKAVLADLEQNNANYKPIYSLNQSLADKINAVAKEIYGAKKVTFNAKAKKDLAKFEAWGYGNLPVCIAKTQNSISHDKNLLGAPSGYTFPITEARLSAGAGFVVVLSGSINTMPGLPKHPAAEDIDVDDNGVISGLF
jgi:formate--tetrahydrofolate ligase